MHVDSLFRLRGSEGIGHVRYPTNDNHADSQIQPIILDGYHRTSLSHNGHLTNPQQLKAELRRDGLEPRDNVGDTELMYLVLTSALRVGHESKASPNQIISAVSEVYKRCQGSFACICMIPSFGVVAFRDPYGIKPLVFGERGQGSSGSDFAIASESVVLQKLGFENFQDIKPGQMVLIPSSWRGNHQPNFHQVVAPRSYAPDIFEYVYLARADSVIDGVSVYDSRRQMGEALARAVKDKLGPVVKTIDCIIPVPDGGYIGALESARALGKPVSLGFVRNQHSCRTFIMPNQEQRLRGVRRKLSTVNAEFQGRNVLIIDDSIVRGTTSREIVAMARKAGARKVYLASLSPAIRFKHIYGIDLADEEKLVAHKRTDEEVCANLGADGLVYLPLPELVDACQRSTVGDGPLGFEVGLFSGNYVTERYPVPPAKSGIERLNSLPRFYDTAEFGGLHTAACHALRGTRIL
ncbi:hypothetical protein TRIATDRAFT_317706 [Trichoderma atroviride IMI 206040]|uniref:Amidophosphoribosyltransferase n=1 Tax=Hypocrea atroviridis (strain ATCC 20476 / IMI 206040) TaxID=452589 RepID=G9NS14_HYPAI|nr:uncharacterized protein TRIATDRAFT_317706 [Trichoderma atroviride IMI 206040]EHK46794.1 hypothetical protein TRIATDRAFT_317706 [Trichoderma atroviride IMI 206040]